MTLKILGSIVSFGSSIVHKENTINCFRDRPPLNLTLQTTNTRMKRLNTSTIKGKNLGIKNQGDQYKLKVLIFSRPFTENQVQLSLPVSHARLLW